MAVICGFERYFGAVSRREVRLVRHLQEDPCRDMTAIWVQLRRPTLTQHFRSEINRARCFHIKDKPKDCLRLNPVRGYHLTRTGNPERRYLWVQAMTVVWGCAELGVRAPQEGRGKKLRRRIWATTKESNVEKSTRFLISSFLSTVKWPLMNLPDNLTMSKLSLRIYLVLAVRLNYHLRGSPLDYGNSDLFSKASIFVFLIASS